MLSGANSFGLDEAGITRLRRWQTKACSLMEGNSRPVAALCIQFANIMLPYARAAHSQIIRQPATPSDLSDGFAHIDDVGGGIVFFDRECIEMGGSEEHPSRLSMKRDSNYVIRLASGLWPRGRNGMLLVPPAHPPLRIREERLRLQDVFREVRLPPYRNMIFTLSLSCAPSDEMAVLGTRLPNAIVREALPIPCWLEEERGQFEDTHNITGADFNLLLQMRSDLHGADVVGGSFLQAQDAFWKTRSNVLFAQGVWMDAMEHLHQLGLEGFRNPDTQSVIRDAGVSARLAAIATAGEIAIALGLVTWPPGTALDAIARCYLDALKFIESYMAPSAECAVSAYALSTGRKIWPGYQHHLPESIRSRL